MSQQLIEYTDYQTPDYCLSCAYFEQEKGHYGRCVDKQDVRIYDGAKKGTGCVVWRIKTKLIGFDGHSPQPEVHRVRLRPNTQLGSLISSEKYQQIHPSPKEGRFTGLRGIVKNFYRPSCPHCGGESVRNGHYETGEQRYTCKGCRRHIHSNGIFLGKSVLVFNEGEKHLRYIFKNHMNPRVDRPAKVLSREYKVISRPARVRDTSRIEDFIKTLKIQESKEVRTNACLSEHPQFVVRNGIRHDKNQNIQRYNCKLCRNRFSVEQIQLKVGKAEVRKIMQSWGEGKSLRQIASELGAFSYMTVNNWIVSYVVWCQIN